MGLIQLIILNKIAKAYWDLAMSQTLCWVLKCIISLDHNHLPVKWKLSMVLHVRRRGNPENLGIRHSFHHLQVGFEPCPAHSKAHVIFSIQHSCFVVRWAYLRKPSEAFRRVLSQERQPLPNRNFSRWSQKAQLCGSMSTTCARSITHPYLFSHTNSVVLINGISQTVMTNKWFLWFFFSFCIIQNQMDH